ncbi:SDR family oxidoreductase [Pseudohoeflea coraliihabitans]|uniref:SDR family oxidoreductase n=1 Tax=Pseudohoeflea coraliihabitans TaxID=2860393 RepID=A0ABS6WP68_9HYPH|nr:SDR family oxidoreductase [Pseudohoeflea sp. DP4N28-3]MBW3097197.1 SDR family oxidoreductase [Pseudohoeflea sp. DP4N28-3]
MASGFHCDLSGKSAIVSGASGVIGGQIAEKLIESGANVAMTYNTNRAPVEDRIRRMQNATGMLAAHKVDYTKLPEIEAHADRVVDEFGAIDIVVNCAGGHLPNSISDGDLTFFDLDPEVMRANVSFNLMSGCMWPCYYYCKKMLDNPEGGSIVNISSMNAYRPLRGRASYAAAKSGVANFTQWLACHLANDFNPMIRVNCIAPGFFPGPHNRGTMTNVDGSLAWRGQEIVAMTPMRRLGAPEDLMGAMLFYVSDMSRYVTGTTIPIDGGFTANAGL